MNNTWDLIVCSSVIQGPYKGGENQVSRKRRNVSNNITIEKFFFLNNRVSKMLLNSLFAPKLKELQAIADSQ